MAIPSEPPYYILVSQPPLLNNASALPLTTFTHPVIEYHYADDPPRDLLPRTQGEHVLVLDYDPINGTPVSVQSLSTELAVIGLKVTEAPGAGIADPEPHKNAKMYVLETTAMPEEIVDEDEYQVPHSILARYKQRNAVLRRALEYPQQQSPSKEPIVTSPETLPTSPMS